MALGELTSVADTAQMFGVSAAFEVREELVSVIVCGATADKIILKQVESTQIQCKLKWNLLRCVTMNGCENTCGEEGLVG